MLRKIWALAVVCLLVVMGGHMALAENEKYEYEGKFYDQTDTDRLRTFLDRDGHGLMINPNYVSEDPATYGVVWEEIEGIQRAVSLEWQDLQIGGKLSLAGMDSLRMVTVSRNLLTELNMSGCYQLTHLYCDGNQMTRLELDGCVRLTDLCADDNLLSELRLEDCVSLSSLFVSANTLERLKLEKLPCLELVQCDGNLLTEIRVKECPELETLYCQNNRLPFLNVSGCTQLKTLCAQDNRLLAVNLADCMQLSTLKLSGNRLTALPDLSAYTNLESDTTDFSGNGFEASDLLCLPESLTANTEWVAVQITATSGISASNPEPVPDSAPEYDLAMLGDVITNRQGAVFAYEAAVAREEEGWALVVSALPSNDGEYYQRNLTLQRDQLMQLQTAGFFEVALRMDDVWVYVPIVEMLEALGEKGTASVMMLAPMAPDEWSDAEASALAACTTVSGTYRYRVANVENGEQVNKTGRIDALRVRVIAENVEKTEAMRIYVVSNQENHQGDMTYYVPIAGNLGKATVFTAEVSGAGSGLIGLAQVAD